MKLKLTVALTVLTPLTVAVVSGSAAPVKGTTSDEEGGASTQPESKGAPVSKATEKSEATATPKTQSNLKRLPLCPRRKRSCCSRSSEIWSSWMAIACTT